MQRVVVLERDPSAPGRARALLGEFDKDLDGRGGDARLVVSELVTSSVRQGEAAGRQPIELSIQLDDASLCVEVWDPGHRRERGAANQPATFVGLGLAVVNRLADAWGVHRDGGTCLWARFDHQRLS